MPLPHTNICHYDTVITIGIDIHKNSDPLSVFNFSKNRHTGQNKIESNGTLGH